MRRDVVVGRRKIEGNGLWRVPALREVEGHAVVGCVHEAAVILGVVDRDAGSFQDLQAVLLQLLLGLVLVAGGLGVAQGRSFEVVDRLGHTVLDEVRPLRREDDVVVEGCLVVDQALQVRAGLIVDLVEEVFEDHLGAVHVVGLLAVGESHLLQALPIDLADVGDNANAVHELALRDLAEELRLRVADSTAGTVAADERIEDHGVLAGSHAKLLSRLLIVGAVHLPGGLHRLRVDVDLGIVVAGAQPNVDAQQQGVLDEQDLDLIDADGGGVRLSEDGVAGLARHEVLAVEPSQIIPHKGPHVRAVDPVRETEHLHLAGGAALFAPLLEERDLVPTQLQLNGEPEANWSTTNDEDPLGHDVWVFAGLAKVQDLFVAVCHPAAFQLVKPLPHAGPLPVASVTDYGLQLLVWEDGILLIVRWPVDGLHHDALDLVIVDLIPQGQDGLSVLRRGLRGQVLLEESDLGRGDVLNLRQGQRHVCKPITPPARRPANRRARENALLEPK
mmetsp:Transcript_62803/g.141863  ORF Transcript_62803/g.141863 Transcript_62803/m.141863 type:complete len:503 (+) Transcript_62803:1250-2758(+)